MSLPHPALVDFLQMAYSAEKAAAFAYIGHADSINDKTDKLAIKQIELDEWNHRSEVLAIMNEYNILPSKYYEFKFHIIGKVISASCYVIGWFMPFYFAGDLESGNVCEYFRMKHYFNEIGISKHDEILYEMAIKEKEHEVYFYNRIKNHRLLPFFERVFKWGKHAKNNVDLETLEPVEKSDGYCVNKSSK
jgi:rubrerythrin